MRGTLHPTSPLGTHPHCLVGSNIATSVFSVKFPFWLIHEASPPAMGGRVARGDLTWRVELPRTLALPLGKSPQQVFIRPAQNVRLHVIAPEPILWIVEHLDQRGEPPVVHDPLARRGGVEVGHVDHARQARVLSGDDPNGIGQVLAQPGRLLGNLRPACRLRDVEPDELVIRRCFNGNSACNWPENLS